MTHRVRADETGATHRLDRTQMGDSPIKKSLRALKLTANQSKAVRELLQPLAESEDIVEGFFQDCAELNPYTALMILEGYEADGFYRTGTTNALHRLLKTFVDEAPVVALRHDFATPVWAVTPERAAQIRRMEHIERVETKCEAKAVEREEKRQAVIIQGPWSKK